EGADETLGGYLFHKALLMSHRLDRLLPHWARRLVLSPALAITPSAIISLAFRYPAKLGQRGKLKALDFLGLIGRHQRPAAYRRRISLFDQRDTRGLFTDEFRNHVVGKRLSDSESESPVGQTPILNRILDLQFSHWLPDDILTKQDKLSMAHAVEGRVPYLD